LVCGFTASQLAIGKGSTGAKIAVVELAVVVPPDCDGVATAVPVVVAVAGTVVVVVVVAGAGVAASVGSAGPHTVASAPRHSLRQKARCSADNGVIVQLAAMPHCVASCCRLAAGNHSITASYSSRSRCLQSQASSGRFVLLRRRRAAGRGSSVSVSVHRMRLRLRLRLPAGAG
jgi:hypothetical protein